MRDLLGQKGELLLVSFPFLNEFVDYTEEK